MKGIVIVCLTVGLCYGAELDRFFKIQGSVIQDPSDSMRIRRVEDVSPEDCAKLCWEEIRCKTIEYKEEHRKCDLSTADYEDTNNNIITSAYGWETYALLPDERSLAELETEGNGKSAERASVQETLVPLEANATEMENLVSQTQSELQEMRESLNSLTESHADFQQQHNELQANVESQKARVTEAAGQKAAVEAKVRANVETLADGQELVSSLQESIAEKANALQQAIQAKSRVEAQLKAVQGHKTNNQTLIANLNKQINQLRADIEEADEPEVIKALDCAELYKKYNTRESGVYNIYPMGTLMNSVQVYCDMTNGGGWTVIQKRDTTKSCKYDFNRLWAEYKAGFGNPESDFYLGNDLIYRLTKTPATLRVEVKSSRGTLLSSLYSSFQIGSESEGYKLKQITYSTGNAGNRLTDLRNTRFGTRNHENNSGSCSQNTQGGFWFKTNRVCRNKTFWWCSSYKNECSSVNLNGRSPVWSSGSTYTAMKIRPRDF